MRDFIDPRTNPKPPYRGAERSLAQDEAQISELIAACKAGRLYAAEAWIASGQPLQVDPAKVTRGTRRSSPLSIAIAEGSHDLALLLLCNGYRTELEHHPPLNQVLEARRWELLDLLLTWGADPRSADVYRILETYDRSVFDRFHAAGVDLASDGSM